MHHLFQYVCQLKKTLNLIRKADFPFDLVYVFVHWCSLKNKLGYWLWVIGDRKTLSRLSKPSIWFWYEISLEINDSSTGFQTFEDHKNEDQNSKDQLIIKKKI